MKRKHLKFSPLILAVLIYGCGTTGTTTGNDPVVVDAEKSTSVALESINAFLKLEYDNQAVIKQRLPQVHTYANFVRVHSPQWIAAARSMTNAYKSNRTAENKANLGTALATLNQAVTLITKYISQINSETAH